MTNKQDDLLTVKNLSVSFKMEDKMYKALYGCSFHLEKGKTLGVVGESGSGKSVMSLAIMKLLPQNAKIDAGEILFMGQDLTKCTENELQKVRGQKIAMIFQEPMTSLNPVLTIGEQIAEMFLVHKHLSHEEAKRKSIEFLDLVKMPSAKKRYSEFPHELSGGMRQRAMIAMALSCAPDLLIADEPTTALDVTVQAQIIVLLNELQRDLGMSILIVTHDFGVISEICDSVAVMYRGRIIETGSCQEVLRAPKHPYTQGLLASTPKIGLTKNLHAIQGQAPGLKDLISGCAFHPRCPVAIDKCNELTPELKLVSETQSASCFMVK